MRIEVIRPTPATPQSVAYERRQPTRRAVNNRHESRSATLVDESTRTALDRTELPNGKNAGAIREILQSHNSYRARHGVPSLEISERMSRLAQTRAEYLAAKKVLHLDPQALDGVVLGENLMMFGIQLGPAVLDAEAAAKDAVRTWYRQITSYDFKRPSFRSETGAFTQLVWKDSRKLGVGIALSSDKRTICIVANYYPAGNILSSGFFEKNVLPTKF